MNSTEDAFGRYTTTSVGILSDASVPPVLGFITAGIAEGRNAEVSWPAVA
jgi:hypothetical protein